MQAERKATRLLVVLILVLHAALALTFKIMFFSYYAVKEIGPSDPNVGGGGSNDANTTRTFRS